jgi:hypothetical protein
MEIGERKRKALVPWPHRPGRKIVLEPTTLQPSFRLSYPLSLALHSSPLSYGLRDTKENPSMEYTIMLAQTTREIWQ